MAPTYTTASTKYGIHRVDGSSNVSDVDDAIRQAVDDVDANMAGYAEGTISAIAGVTPTAGKFYRTTDSGQVYMGTGSAWIEIGVSPWSPGDLRLSWVTFAPPGWLICDGAAVSRVTYGPLFAIIGTSAGAGDGSTTFNVPDLRGRVFVMPDGSAGRMASNDTRGLSGGAQRVTLADSEVPDTAVTGVNAGGSPPPQVGGIGIRGDTVGGGANFSLSTRSDGAFSFGLKVDGGGADHENMPPYLVGGSVQIKT